MKLIFLIFLVICVSSSSAHESESVDVSPSTKDISKSDTDAEKVESQYHFAYSTSDDNGLNMFREERKNLEGLVSGKYGYVDPNGHLRVVNYEAGNDGFVASGDIGPDQETLKEAKRLHDYDAEQKRPFLEHWNKVAQSLSPAKHGHGWSSDSEVSGQPEVGAKFEKYRSVRHVGYQQPNGYSYGYSYTAPVHNPSAGWDHALTNIQKTSDFISNQHQNIWNYQKQLHNQFQTPFTQSAGIWPVAPNAPPTIPSTFGFPSNKGAWASSSAYGGHQTPKTTAWSTSYGGVGQHTPNYPVSTSWNTGHNFKHTKVYQPQAPAYPKKPAVSTLWNERPYQPKKPQTSWSQPNYNQQEIYKKTYQQPENRYNYQTTRQTNYQSPAFRARNPSYTDTQTKVEVGHSGPYSYGYSYSY